MLDAGRTALVLRGLQRPDGCYPFLERRWRVRARQRRHGPPGIPRRVLAWLRVRLSGSAAPARPSPVPDMPLG